MKKLLSLLLITGLQLCSAPPSASASTVNVYPMPSCFTLAGSWGLTANGTSIPIRAYKPHTDLIAQYYYAHLGISGGSVTFVVDATETISTWTISPKAYNITPTINGTTMTFTLSSSKYLEIKVNSKPLLCLMVDNSEVNPPPPSGSGIYNVVTQYGAATNGTTMDTTNIQNAINAAYSAGGGTVYFPAGIFLCNKLTLKNNVYLYFAPGSCLLADSNKNNWPNPTGGNAFIDASSTSNVKIFGRGTIACRGCTVNGDVRTDQAGQCIIKPIYGTTINTIVLEGVILNESTGWTVDLENAQNITVSNLKVFNEKTWQWNDGIDMCGSHDATITHCYVNTCDDGCCVKAIDYPTYNITYSDLVIDTTDGSAVKAGCQSEKDLYNLTFTNFNVVDCDRGLSLEHWYGTGNWHDIHFIDGRVEKVSGTTGSLNSKGTYYDLPFRFEISAESSGGYDYGAGPISKVEVTRVTFDGAGPTLPTCGGRTTQPTSAMFACPGSKSITATSAAGQPTF